MSVSDAGKPSHVESSVQKSFCVKRKSIAEALVALGALCLVLVCGVQFMADNTAVLNIFLGGFSIAIFFLYIRSTDTLKIGPNNTLVYAHGFVLKRSKININIDNIQFVGIAGSEKFPQIGSRHQVYIQHNDKVVPIRCFRSGRESVLLAKSLRNFIES